MNLAKRAISAIEHTSMTFVQGLAAFVCIIVVKIILENFANNTTTGIVVSDVNSMLHYLLWFGGSYLSLVLVNTLVGGIDLVKTSKYLLFVHLLIWLTPIIDLLALKGNAPKLGYIYLAPSELFSHFINLGASYKAVSLGQNIVVPLVVLLCAYYVYINSRSILKSVLSALFSYCTVFVWGAFPSIFKMIHDLFVPQSRGGDVTAFYLQGGGNPILSENLIRATDTLIPQRFLEVIQVNLFSQLFFLTVIVLLTIWTFWFNREHFYSILGNTRSFGIIHYYGTILLGMAAATFSSAISFDWVFVSSFLTLFVSFYSAYMFAVGTNDIADVNIDRVSNADRPLPKNKLTILELQNYNLAFLGIALAGGALVGHIIFYCILVAVSISYIYSLPPLRLKRVPFLATFLIGLASFSAFAAGFYFLNISKAIDDMPIKFVLALLVFHTLWGNVKDIKDREGDKRDGVMTLANIFPLPTAKLVVAIICFVAYLSVPLILEESGLLLPGAIAGTLTAFLIFRKSYSHYSVFLIYFVYLLFLIISAQAV
jgi:homogentisate phytyltransferase / homogentisate geranylgeranyltransferase